MVKHMGWLRDAEHFRDYGHTWGPGIDDYEEPTEEEQLTSNAQYGAYQKELAVLRVAARETYEKTGKELGVWASEQATSSVGWREQLSRKKMEACKRAAEKSGCSFGLRDGNEDKDQFLVSVEFYGYLPGRGGNIHHFAASGIADPEQCLQLVADFSAIGCRTTTFYQNHYISEDDTARLRKEMERWGISFDQKEMMEKEVEALAEALDQFAYDFDTYEYQDRVEDREQAVLGLKEDIASGNIAGIQEWHKDITLEDCDRDVVLESRTLMKWLENVEKKIQGERKVSLDAKIQSAVKACGKGNKEQKIKNKELEK